MKKMIFTALFLGISLFLFAGCGQEDAPSGAPPEQAQNSQEMPGAPNANTLFSQKCISLPLKFPDSPEYAKAITADSYDGKFYLLSKYWNKEEGIYRCNYALYTFDGNSQELEPKSFSLELPDQSPYYITSMEVKDSNTLSLRLAIPDGEEDSHDSLAVTDMTGKLLSLEENFPAPEQYPWNASYLDYLTTLDNPDGTTILCQWNKETEKSSMFWFDKADGRRSPLGEVSGQPLSSLYLDGQNNLYYIAEGNLIRWNPATDNRQNLIRLTDIGLPLWSEYTGLLFNSQGEALVCSIMNADGKVFVLSEEEPQAAEEIRFTYLQEDLPRYTIKLSSSFSYEHPQCPVKSENVYGTDLKDRIFMELATGEGPELMWVDKEDMGILAEKGVLMDLTEVIPEEIYEQLFPGVIQDGTINGTLVGISPFFSVQSMAVPNAVWGEGSWTLSDLLAVAEARDDWDVLLANPYLMSNYNLFCKLLPGLEGTPFLDLEQKKAHLDHENFARLLELCMQYGNPYGSDPEYLGWDEVGRLMHEAQCAAQLSYLEQGFQEFSSLLADFGDDIHLVGFPSYGDSGHYMGSPNGYLVVNKNAAHLEEIKEYMALFLDYDSQMALTFACSVRRDVTEDRVQVNFDGEPVFVTYDSSYGQLQSPIEDLKPDGTTYIKEYMDFLESSVPWPEDPSQISAILKEELGAYFSGAKSLEETVDVLQNRVQLYLDENR